jgi:hypothetical protein
MNTADRSRSASFDIGAVITAPTKDPQWMSKCGLMGLLSLIPIAGALNMMGWMRAITERRVGGGADADILPPAGLDYMGAGWRFFLARLPLMALFGFVAMVGFGSSLGLMALGGALEDVGSVLFGATYLAIVAGSFAFSVAAPAIDFLHIIDGDTWASLAFGRQWETARAGGTNYVLAFIANLVGGMIGQMGVFACFVGVFVTAPYAVALQAAVIAEYARVLATRPVGGMPAVRVGGVGGGGGAPFGVGGS